MYKPCLLKPKNSNSKNLVLFQNVYRTKRFQSSTFRSCPAEKTSQDGCWRQRSCYSPPIVGWFNFVYPNYPVRCGECLFQVFKFHIFISDFDPPCSIIPAINQTVKECKTTVLHRAMRHGHLAELTYQCRTHH